MKVGRFAGYMLGVLTIALATLSAQQAPQSQPPPAPPRSPLLSDERDKDLPKWLRFSCEYRGRAEGSAGGGLKPNNDAAYILSRLRLNMTVEPKRWLKLRFQARDAHVFWKNPKPSAPPYQS